MSSRRIALSVLSVVALASCAREPAPAAPTVAPVASVAAPVEPAVTPAPAAPSASNREFEPGKRLGAVTATTDETQLKMLFGEANVIRRDWQGPEGESTPAIVVFADTPDEFWVLWRDIAFTVPDRIMIVGGNWRTVEGLHVGSDFASLRELNGGDFDFAGFDWDYGGVVMSWRTGLLAQYAGKLAVHLDYPEGANLPDAFIGDQTIGSEKAGADRLGLRVSAIDIAL